MNDRSLETPAETVFRNKIKIGSKVYNTYHKKEYTVYKLFKNHYIAYCRSSSGSTHTFGFKDLELI